MKRKTQIQLQYKKECNSIYHPYKRSLWLVTNTSIHRRKEKKPREKNITFITTHHKDDKLKQDHCHTHKHHYHTTIKKTQADCPLLSQN